MIELAGVEKSYEGAVILPALDLRLSAGITTVLIGPSGCGKSTLLRLMIGLVRPDLGSVSVAGVRLTPENILEIRRKMGYVIQDGGLFPHLSARDNVTLTARYLRWDRRRIEAGLQQLADLTRLPLEALNRFPAQLSGGQRQRVGLMRALMLDPKVILLDEPLGALDPLVRSDLQQDLRTIFRTLKKTVVMVTHDLAEAGWFGDEILLLREGRIVQRGVLNDFLRNPVDEFVARFVRAQRRTAEAFAGENP